jgi:hypothetical protein
MIDRVLRRTLLRAACEGRLDPTVLTPLALSLAGLHPEPGMLPQQIVDLLRIVARAKETRPNCHTALVARRLGYPGRWRTSSVIERLHAMRTERRWALVSDRQIGIRQLERRLGSWTAVRRLLTAVRAAGIELRPQLGCGRCAYGGHSYEVWDTTTRRWYRVDVDGAGSTAWVEADPPTCLCARLDGGMAVYSTPAEAIAALGREIERLRREWPEEESH